MMLDLNSSNRRRLVHVLTLASCLLPAASAQLGNTFKYVGLSGVSAQQMFLGRPGKVYIVDKTGESLDDLHINDQSKDYVD